MRLGASVVVLSASMPPRSRLCIYDSAARWWPSTASMLHRVVAQGHKSDYRKCTTCTMFAVFIGKSNLTFTNWAVHQTEGYLDTPPNSHDCAN
jgi:hypothetical protein